MFVGKLIASKGVELLLAAFPLVLAREPRARLMIVGFGAFRPVWSGWPTTRRPATSRPRPRHAPRTAGAAAAARVLSQADDATATPPGLSDRSRGRAARPRRAPDLLPAAEAMAVTSTSPRRSDGLRGGAAQRAAGRRRPLGLGEVARTLSQAVPRRGARWLSFEITDDAVPQLADALSGWLAAPDDLRPATRDAIVEATRARYSWEGVAAHVIAAARATSPTARAGLMCQAAVARAIANRSARLRQSRLVRNGGEDSILRW